VVSESVDSYVRSPCGQVLSARGNEPAFLQGSARPRVMRVLRSSSDKFWHIIRITRPDHVDDELLGWLTEAYDYATD
jgi:hypothetical protein